MYVLVSSSNAPMAHPPRSNPLLRSSSDAWPFPCITPSTVIWVIVVNFIVVAPFALRMDWYPDPDPANGSGLGDDLHFVGGVVEAAAAVGGDRHDVLDADPELPRQVDPGLDREAHPGYERLALALHHVRRLVGGQPDAVAHAVHEELAVPGIVDHLAGDPVDLLAL